MSLTPSLVAVTTSAAQLVVIQPGQTALLCSPTLFTIGLTSGVTVGGAASFAVPANVPVPFTVPNDEGAAPVTLYAIAGSSFSVSVMVTGAP